MQTQQTTATGPVTLEEVRAALGETSPFDSNASKIRAIIGRGSFATIQKHLDTLRAERIAAAQPQTTQDVPKAPDDLVAAVWSSAWNAAQTKTLGRLESLSAERDALQATAAAQVADLSALTEQLDTLDTQAQSHASALATAQAAALANEQHAATAVVQAAAAFENLRAELARVTAAAEHAAALAVRDAQIERQTLQSTIDRMSEQLSEVKALHMIAATAAQKPAAAQKPDDKK